MVFMAVFHGAYTILSLLSTREYPHYGGRSYPCLQIRFCNANETPLVVFRLKGKAGRLVKSPAKGP